MVSGLVIATPADRNRVDIADKEPGFSSHPEELLALNEALDRMDTIDSRLRQLVEYRFYCGLSEKETAELLGVTVRTVQRDWVKARAFLYGELYADGT